MQIFLTERIVDFRLLDGLVEHPAVLRTMAASSDAIEAMPFVLTSDGVYDHQLNAFFRELPHLGVPAENSWRTYATQLIPLARFICGTCGRRSLAAGTLRDFQDYKRLRRDSREPQIAASTWNLLVAALEKFFQFATLYGHIDAAPFIYAVRHVWTNGCLEQRQVNALYESVAIEDVVRCVSIEEYEFFRDFGLRTGGTRNALRDVALAELLVTTGMRITECLVLLREELPPGGSDSGPAASEALLSESTTKRRKARHIWVSHRVMMHYVDRYARTDRAHAAAAARRSGRYASLPGTRRVLDIGTASVAFGVDGARNAKGFELLTVAERRSLYRHVDGVLSEPLVLWCSEKGLPLSEAAVRMSFQRACDRCNENGEAQRRFGRPMRVTPHTLRHTFAVAHLSQLIRQAGKTVRDVAGMADGNDAERLRRAVTSPMNQLRKALGHSSETTTYKYLTYLDQARTAALAAVRAWDSLLTRDTEQTRQRRD